MQELSKLPMPLCNYQGLIKRRVKPYYDIVMYLLREMDNRYKLERREFVYAPDIREMEERVQNEKLTRTNIIRSIKAWIKTAGLSDDEFYVTTTGNGGKNYHIRVNERTLNLLKNPL